MTEQDYFTALRTFLLGVLPSGVEVVQSQDNRVPEPLGPDHVLMTATDRMALSTTATTWDFTDVAPDALGNIQSTQFNVQLDIYGPAGADHAQVIATLFRSIYGAEHFNAAQLAPLYCDDGHQAPFVNGEGQMEARWTMKLSFQILSSVSTPQSFADTLQTIFRPVGGS